MQTYVTPLFTLLHLRPYFCLYRKARREVGSWCRQGCCCLYGHAQVLSCSNSLFNHYLSRTPKAFSKHCVSPFQSISSASLGSFTGCEKEIDFLHPFSFSDVLCRLSSEQVLGVGPGCCVTMPSGSMSLYLELSGHSFLFSTLYHRCFFKFSLSIFFLGGQISVHLIFLK